MFALDGVTAVVTGAAQGIGAATARGLAGQGATVTLLDRAVGVRTVLDEPHRGVVVDVTEHAALEAAITAGLAAGAGPPVLVCNAAIVDTTPLAELDAARFDQVHAVNLTATLVAIRAAARAMRGRGGRIITIASIAGRQGGGAFGTAAYASSKGGLIALTRSAARELATDAITVNAVAPGPVRTALLAGQTPEQVAQLLAKVPLGRYGTPDDVAAAVCFLASREAGWITGAVLDVNGGLLMS